MAAGLLKTSRSFGEVIYMSQKTVHVRARRGFVLAGRDKPVEPKEIVEVPLTLARELIGASQAERFDPNDPANKPASQTLVTRSEPAASADAGKPRAPKPKEGT